MTSELVLGAGVIALGLFLWLGVSKIRLGAGYDRIGPRFFPYVVAAGLVLLGGWLAFEGLRKRASAEKPESQTALNWSPLGYLALALLLNLALLEPAGFVAASSVLFWLAARAFHSRRPVRDGIVALIVSVLVYVAFSRFLGLNLPAGVLGGMF